jgi:hypothetical protein
VITYCSIEAIDPGDLSRVPLPARFLNVEGQWEDVLYYGDRGGLFPSVFDLHPTIDDFVRGKLLELDSSQVQLSLIFRYRKNWCYGVGYREGVIGVPMNLARFYSCVSFIVRNI